MISLVSLIKGLRENAAGAIAVETAIIAPVLVMLSLGTFDASKLVARQTELQSAAGIVESIALSSSPDTPEELATVKQIIMTSTGLSADQVELTNSYRCGIESTLVTPKTTCALTDVVSTYLTVNLTDTYTPVWTNFGIGSPIQYNVTRRVAVS